MLYALGAALCFGTATALQARAARQAEEADGAVGLLVKAARQVPYLTGLVLDSIGFLLEVIALRSIPVYAVSAAMASCLAVTAVVAGPLLDVRLRGAEWASILTVCGGLAVLALGSGKEGASHGDATMRWAALVASIVLVLLAGGRLTRLTDRTRATVLGLASGFGFGIVEISVRLLDPLTPHALLANPAGYALFIGGGAAFLLLTSALRRGSVTAATAAMVLGETIGPALIGILALGDSTRAGWAPATFLGFALAVAGALALARFGEGGTPTTPSAPSPRRAHATPRASRTP